MKKHFSQFNSRFHSSIICVFVLTFQVFSSAAQTASPCPTDNLSNYPGAWKQLDLYSAPGHIKAKPGSYDKSVANANLEKLLNLAKKAYPQPMGGNVNYNKYLDFSNVYDYLPFGYRLYIGHPGFVCTVGDKVTETYETGVYLSFQINNYEPFVSPITAREVFGTDYRIGVVKGSESDYGINGQRVFLIHENFVSSNGWMDHYTEEIYGGREPRQQWFVIRKENVPLFRYVTRKEYLTQFREELFTYRDIYVESIEEGYKKFPESYSQVYESLGEFKIQTENAVKRVDNYLQNSSEEELNKQVSELFFHGNFIMENETEINFRKDRFHMVFVNEDYMDKKLPHHIAQFVIVELSAPVQDKTGRYAWKYNFRQKMMEGLDFKEIHNMLLK
ncbi:hypothetical protein [Shivajiella indica]|uniref:Uncharacterized protein n=1 Tax=Shivajiella indica TaxID=872115 RepID=A0ABW5B949_9BACT